MSGKKTLVITLVILAAVAAGVAGYMTRDSWMGMLSSSSRTEGDYNVFTKDGVRYKEIYTCPMHPQVVKPTMGSCPICGMDLIKKEIPLDKEKPMHETGHEGHDMGMTGGMEGMSDMGGLDRIALDPRQRMLANVATEEAVVKDLSQDVLAVGRVAYNEETLKVASAWFPGRVERMLVHYDGESVRKGQRMMSIYSPELVSAQKEYLIAMDTAERLDTSGFPELSDGSKGMVEAGRARLMQWGLTEEQVDEVARTKTPMTTLDVYAPVGGTVTKISVREGDYVREGTELFRVADLSTVWVNAELYEFEFSKAAVGAHVEVTADSFPGEVFHGKVSFIDPVVDMQSRTVRVRAELPNRGGKLKPEMFVDARVHSRAKRSLSIPASSVLYTGMSDVVWVEVEPGAFEPREVKLGIRSGDDFEVLSGIEAGDMVVTQGGFLLDSEAELRRGAGLGAHAGHAGMDMGGGSRKDASGMEDMEGMSGGHQH